MFDELNGDDIPEAEMSDGEVQCMPCGLLYADAVKSGMKATPVKDAHKEIPWRVKVNKKTGKSQKKKKAEAKKAKKEVLTKTEVKTARKTGQVNGLFDNPKELNGLGDAEKWVRLDVVVDSGASESVAPTSMCRGLQCSPVKAQGGDGPTLQPTAKSCRIKVGRQLP